MLDHFLPHLSASTDLQVQWVLILGHLRGHSGWGFNSTGSYILEVVESSLLEGRECLLNMDSIRFLEVRLTILWKGRSSIA